MSKFIESAKKTAEQYNENITLEKIHKELNLSLESKITPIRVLEYVSKSYSGLWDQIEKIAISNFYIPKWDKKIFVPTFFWLPTLLNLRYPNWHTNFKGKNMPIWGLDFFSVCAIGTWRYTKGIYKLDDEVAKHFFVNNSDLKIPSSLLERQPEWSMFVDTHNLDLELLGKKVIGFWSNISCLPAKGTPYSENKILVIVPLFEDGVGYLLSASIPLSEDTILTIEQGTQDVIANLSYAAYVDDNRSSNELNQLNSFKKKVVQILLFIIQPEPDIYEHNQIVDLTLNKPQLKVIKGKYRLFEAKKPRFFDVGRDTGNALRTALSHFKGGDRKQKPHIRKAHWHGYWKGSKKKNTREFFYEWIPPVIVNQYEEFSASQGDVGKHHPLAQLGLKEL